MAKPEITKDILIEEIPHEALKRDGNNVIFELYVNFGQSQGTDHLCGIVVS